MRLSPISLLVLLLVLLFWAAVITGIVLLIRWALRTSRRRRVEREERPVI